jgi:hypothetical protein
MFACASTPHVASRRARSTRAVRCTERSLGTRRRFPRLAENADYIRGFGASDVCSIGASGARGHSPRHQENCRDDALSMPSGLCKNLRPRRLQTRPRRRFQRESSESPRSDSLVACARVVSATASSGGVGRFWSEDDRRERRSRRRRLRERAADIPSEFPSALRCRACA